MKFNGFKYSIVDNYKDAIDEELLSSKITDYYNTFDYIVGDWAYNKLRLKGFYEDSNPKALSYNKISTLDNYLKTKREFSKSLLIQESALIWITSLAYIVLAFYCISNGYTGSLPWITASASLPWAAYGVSQVFYYKKSITVKK